MAPRINEKRFLKGCEWFGTRKGKRMVLLNVLVSVWTAQKERRRIILLTQNIDSNLTDILLFILLEQMFARRERNERKRDNNDYLSVGRVIIASSPNSDY